MCDKDLEYYMRLTQIGGIYDDFQSMILQMASYIRNEDQTQAIKEHAGFKEPDRVRRTEADTYTHKRPEPSTNPPTERAHSVNREELNRELSNKYLLEKED